MCPTRPRSTRDPFDAHTLRVLRAADVMIRAAAPADDHAVFDTCRAAMEQLAPVTSFMAGLVRHATRQIAFPYEYDHGEYQGTTVLPFGERGLTGWLVASQRTYRFSDDAGACVHTGYAFGHKDELTRDAVAVPFLDPEQDGEQRVRGYLVMMSNAPGSYTDEHAAALEWLARAVSAKWASDAASPHLRELYDLDTATSPATIEDAVTHANIVLSGISVALSSVVERHPELAEELGGIVRLCATTQEDLDQMLTHHEPVSTDRLALLTRREREVALLVAARPAASNKDVAAELGIAEATAKVHLGRALRKLGLSHRSELRWAVGESASQYLDTHNSV